MKRAEDKPASPEAQSRSAVQTANFNYEDPRQLALKLAVEIYAVETETNRDDIFLLAARFFAYLTNQNGDLE